MLGALLNTLAGGQSLAQGDEGAQIVGGSFDISNYSMYQSLLDSLTAQGVPHAYINYLVFDENMVLDPSQSGAIQIGATAGSWQGIGTFQPVHLNSTGYLLVYLSTSVLGHAISFDHLSISILAGYLLQEQNYYPFGLAINEGESNTIIPNQFKYQCKEMHDEVGLNLDDFTARNYDHQIGRFCSTDPASQMASEYTGMANNPANMIDPSGCWSGNASGSYYSDGRSNNNGFNWANVVDGDPQDRPGVKVMLDGTRLNDLAGLDFLNNINKDISGMNSENTKILNSTEVSIPYTETISSYTNNVAMYSGVNPVVAVGYYQQLNVTDEIDYDYSKINNVGNLARGIIRDFYSIGLTGDQYTGGGGALDATIYFVLRGKDPGIYRTHSVSNGVQTSVSCDVGITIGGGYFVSSNLSKYSSKDLSGDYRSVSGGASLQVGLGTSVMGGLNFGIGQEGVVTFTQNFTITIGVGVSSPVIGNLSSGNTSPLIKIW